MNKPGIFLPVLLFCMVSLSGGQELDLNLSSEQTHAVLEGGISYDLLRYPAGVSFDYPEGRLSFNFPLDLTTDSKDFGSNLSGSQDKFTPTFGAKQRMNFSLRVDVPMLGGVVSYSQVENVNFGLKMNLGSQIRMDTTMLLEGLGTSSLVLNGAINAPIVYEMGWRTQTFGYAFRPMNGMVVAVNFHKHLFEATANGFVNANILGNVGIDISKDVTISKDLGINYSEEDVYGRVTGNYEGSAWSPSFGIKWWRLMLTARFGVNTRVSGDFLMQWNLPFFINPNPKSFGIQEDELVVTSIQQDSAGNLDPSVLDDIQTLQNRLDKAETDSFVLRTEKDAEFNIPSGYTLTFEAVRNHLSFSYTYINGAISGYHVNEDGDVDFNLGFEVNHMLLMDFTLWIANMKAGLFALDFYEGDKKNWLSDGAESSGLPVVAGGMLTPVLSFSTAFGSSWRIPLELDVLPIPALKTGLIYYF